MFDPNSLPLPSTSQQLRVRSQGRIHFGLLEISESEPNCYGGIGLMIEHSIAVVQATIGPSSISQCSIQADVHWRPRIEAIATQWLQTHSQLPIQSISVIESPPPHQGLGSGTQMASTVAALLAVAELICRVGVVLQAELTLNMLFSIEALAKLSQRGKRSNIGLLGFLEGGFVVDHGQPSPNGNGTISKERTQRIAFPDWPVLIIQDTKSLGDSGNDEASMFELCSRCSNPNRIAMVQLVQQEMLPAIAARDWKQFDIALGRYGRWAGQIFETVQGGIYRTRQIAHSVDVANQLGLKGATQSSWGPTVCAIARDDEHARWCQSRLQSEMPSVVVTTTKAANYSAQVELL